MFAPRASTLLLAFAAPLILVVEPTLAQTQVAARTSDATPLVGEWRGEVFSGGVGTRLLLNLFDNGTYSQRSTIVSEYGWTLEGDTLLMAPVIERGAQPKFGKAMALQLELAGDSLIAVAKKQQIVLRRQTVRVDHSPLLGRWEGMSDLNEPITQDFTHDGRLIITVVLTREAGRYSVSKREITWNEQIPRPRRHRTRYKLTDDTLTIFSPAPLPPVELVRAPSMF
jgi:hypothetical protein